MLRVVLDEGLGPDVLREVLDVLHRRARTVPDLRLNLGLLLRQLVVAELVRHDIFDESECMAHFDAQLVRVELRVHHRVPAQERLEALQQPVGVIREDLRCFARVADQSAGRQSDKDADSVLVELLISRQGIEHLDRALGVAHVCKLLLLGLLEHEVDHCRQVVSADVCPGKVPVRLLVLLVPADVAEVLVPSVHVASRVGQPDVQTLFSCLKRRRLHVIVDVEDISTSVLEEAVPHQNWVRLLLHHTSFIRAVNSEQGQDVLVFGVNFVAFEHVACLIDLFLEELDVLGVWGTECEGDQQEETQRELSKPSRMRRTLKVMSYCAA